MAEVLNTYEFPQVRRGAPALYPWDMYTDGRIWRVYEGVDCRDIVSFRNQLYTAANKRGLSAITHSTVANNGRKSLVFQCLPKGA